MILAPLCIRVQSTESKAVGLDNLYWGVPVDVLTKSYSVGYIQKSQNYAIVLCLFK